MYNKNNNPYNKASHNTYKDNEVNTVSPAKLIELLYKNSVERLDKSKNLIKEKNWDEVNRQLTRVQDIITELNVSLNMEQGGEISKNLRALYDYIYRRLVEANINKSPEIVSECREMINDLLITWREAMKKASDTIKDMTSQTKKSRLDIET